MKTKIVYVTVVLFGLLATTSCEKKQTVNPTTTAEPVTVKDETAMTLKEFADSRTNEVEKNFFATTAITNNTSDFSELMSANLNSKVSAAQKPRIKFKWHGVNPKGHGCETPLGICIILGFDGVDAAAIEMSVGIVNGKFAIAFPNDINSNYGLTINGYMPILFDLDIPADVALDLGITTPNPKIKAGIYKANYDAEQNRYTGIALTIK